LLTAYQLFPGKDSFFLKNNFINKLAGTATLQEQIKQGKTAAAIIASWQPGLASFKKFVKNICCTPTLNQCLINTCGGSLLFYLSGWYP
jgi:hypothetical protein